MKTLSTKHNITLNDLSQVAIELKKLFIKPQVLLLSGSLGAGKTTLVRLLLNQSQKNNEVVTSPAFAVHHHYLLDLGYVEHIDLYRIKNDEDLESTGFWDVFSEPHKKSLIIIEWANRINIKCFPPLWNYLKVNISFGAEKNTRSIKIQSL